MIAFVSRCGSELSDYLNEIKKKKRKNDNLTALQRIF